MASLTLAGSAAPSVNPTDVPSLTGIPTAMMTTVVNVISTKAPGATVAAAPVAGDNNNTGNVSASATVMIVIGVVLGIVGVASVITLIWWMRRRHLARFRNDIYPTRDLYPPVPPPKSAGADKALPSINVASANAYGGHRAAPLPPQKGRSNTVGSIDKDKALPTKPADSIKSPAMRPAKSPALVSHHEMRAQMPRSGRDEEAGYGRMRSDSMNQEPTAPANFI